MTNFNNPLQRIDAIDALRGFSIFLMGQYHFMVWFPWENSPSGTLYTAVLILGKISAPFFLLISGIGSMLLFNNSKIKHISSLNIFITNIKRGLFIISLSVVFNIFSYTLFNSGALLWEWNVFQLIGVMYLLTICLGYLPPYSIFFFFFLILTFNLYSALLPESIVNTLTIGIVPIVPWANFYLLGCLLGCFLSRLRRLERKKLYSTIKSMGISASIVVVFLAISFPQKALTLTVNNRTSLLAIAFIFLLFTSIFSWFYVIDYNKYFKFEFLNHIGCISLTTYYIHIVFKYVLVALTQFFFDIALTNLSIYGWFAMNLIFWSLLFIIIEKFWTKYNYIFSLEWFINKYISKKSLFNC